MWIDLTLPLNETSINWPTEQPFHIQSRHTNDCVSSMITTSVHVGTHLDAPRHFIPTGELIDAVDINQLMGLVQVIEINDKISIKPHHLHSLNCSKVIFKTCNEITNAFNENYCYLSPEAASYLVKMGVKLVGIDYLSIDDFNDTNFTSHKILLSNNILVLESLNTSPIKSGYYNIIALPLKISAEASPVRVIVRPVSS